MIKKIEVDLESFSHFWLILNEKGLVEEASNYLSQLNCIGKRAEEAFEFIQPSLTANSVVHQLLPGKIIQLKVRANGMSFRFTAHVMGAQLLMIGWPSVTQLEELKSQELTKYMRHPACQITDVIILKDVLKRSQQTIRNLEKEQYQREIEEQRQIALHQSKLASLGELSAGIAHEINNPLAVSMGLTDILKKVLSSEEIKNTKVFEYLDKISTANLRIRNIVKGLQTYARVDDNQEQIFSVKDVIEQTLELISEIFTKDGVDLQYEGHLEDIKVKGLAGELQQVLMNLLNNAKHATLEKSEKVIRIGFHSLENGRVAIFVEDNGHGISKELQNKIFRPFFTTKPAGMGTGLGLAITHKIIKKMSGDIQVGSEVGKGTKFTVILPVVSEAIKI